MNGMHLVSELQITVENNLNMSSNNALLIAWATKKMQTYAFHQMSLVSQHVQ